MAFVKCPDCGRKVSERADFCPRCGCPGRCFPGKLQAGVSYDFGNYGGEPLRWRVLDVQGKRALLMCEKAIDCMQYHHTLQDITWSQCSLRRWLNGEFLEVAFGDSERALIYETALPGNGDPERSSSGASIMRDAVFCLSIGEVQRYFRNDGERMCYPSKKAVEAGIARNDNGACGWWLRLSGDLEDYAAYVDSFGSVNTFSRNVVNDYHGVRPALWLNL